MVNVITPAPHGKAVSARLVAAGFRPGSPGHISGKTCAIDVQLCHEMCCGHCGSFGLGADMYQKGPAYVVVACCLLCGQEEEF